MIFTYDEMFRRLEERTADNKQELDKTRRQRRDEFTDMFGTPFQAIGDANVPAQIFISVSQDCIEFMRFQFKLAIQPFLSTVSGGTQSEIVDVQPTSLTINNNNIVPNPHEHDTVAHSHNIVSGVTASHTTSDDFTLKVQGIDVTPYLMEQYDGKWIEGEGMYPSMSMKENYDLLRVAGLMRSEGKIDEYNALTEPDYKLITIESDRPFAVTLYLYLKYSNMGR